MSKDIITIEKRYYKITYVNANWENDYIILINKKNIIEFWTKGLFSYVHWFNINCKDFKKVEEKILNDPNRKSIKCETIKFIDIDPNSIFNDTMVIGLEQFCKTERKWYDFK
jgi:hypothetical protein